MSLTTLAAFDTLYTAVLGQVQGLQAWLDAHEQHWLQLVASSIHRYDKSFIAASRRHVAWIASMRSALFRLEWRVQDAQEVLQVQLAHLKAAMEANDALLAQLVDDLDDLLRSITAARSFHSTPISSSYSLLDESEDAAHGPIADLCDSLSPAAVAVAMEPRTQFRLIRRGRCAPPRFLQRRARPWSPPRPFVSPTRSIPTPPAPPALHTHPQHSFRSSLPCLSAVSSDSARI
ncbi:hypothetical protein EXIGLDRAFT_838211 [Exidia glandulosa HHB12029]|uniref:Uncharacterized protein n=1 Tax=Exidia glandulosa HHB12029 TaxID=1314781 RepID=A0A166A9U4_EXIGL|nr:hypothetical protein EXIGLDRAFT_838211 [Exidia glandulosa HHB12029]